MKSVKIFVVVLAAVLIGLVVYNSMEDTPLENLGDQISETSRDIGNGIEDACEDISNKNC